MFRYFCRCSTALRRFTEFRSPQAQTYTKFLP